MIAFKDPLVLLLIPCALLAVFFFGKKRKRASIRFPSKKILATLPRTWRVKYGFISFMLRLIVVTLFIIALAGPRTVLEETVYNAEGIDIVLTVDISGSMAAEDFKIKSKRQNRLFVVKKVVAEFVDKRISDRIGLVAFSGFAQTVCPLTTDYPWLVANLDRLRLGLIEDGTAVGSAIATSVLRLKRSDAKSKIIILLTDGVNNAGQVDPVSAAKVAQAMGIKIYTIGAGSKGKVPYPVADFFGNTMYRSVEIGMDEETLKEISELTGGQYYRATGTESLRKIYDEIDQLEKTEIEETGYFSYNQLFDEFVMVALLMLLMEAVLSRTLFLKVP